MDITPMNNKQNQSIARLDERIKSLEGKLEVFINNEFEHLREDFKYLRNRVDWILGIVILGTVITIAVQLAFRG